MEIESSRIGSPRLAGYAAAGAMILLMAGCSPSYSGNLYKLNIDNSCPTSVEKALAPINVDPILSTSEQMSCALQTIRNLRPPHRSPKGHESLAAAKLCVVLAESSPDTREGNVRRGELGWEGVAWAEHAMRTGSFQDAATSYYYSICLGVAVRNSIMAAMRYMDKLHMHLKRAVRESPNLDHGGPLRTLGYFKIKAPAWPVGPGDAEEGLEMLQTAAERFPDYPPNQIYVARGYWEGDDDDEQAMEGIKAAVELLKKRNWGLRHDAWVRDLKDLVTDMLDEEEALQLMSGLEPAPPQTDVKP